jgi:hypothetical protein
VRHDEETYRMRNAYFGGKETVARDKLLKKIANFIKKSQINIIMA